MTWDAVLLEPLVYTTQEQCSANLAQLITVIVGVFSRPAYFEQVTAAILDSTANVTRLWIVCNGSPHLEIFRAKTAHEGRVVLEGKILFQPDKVKIFRATPRPQESLTSSLPLSLSLLL